MWRLKPPKKLFCFAAHDPAAWLLMLLVLCICIASASGAHWPSWLLGHAKCRLLPQLCTDLWGWPCCMHREAVALLTCSFLCLRQVPKSLLRLAPRHAQGGRWCFWLQRCRGAPNGILPNFGDGDPTICQAMLCLWRVSCRCAAAAPAYCKQSCTGCYSVQRKSPYCRQCKTGGVKVLSMLLFLCSTAVHCTDSTSQVHNIPVSLGACTDSTLCLQANDPIGLKVSVAIGTYSHQSFVPFERCVCWCCRVLALLLVLLPVNACCAISVSDASCLHPPGSREALEVLAGASQGLRLCSGSSPAVSGSEEPCKLLSDLCGQCNAAL